MSEEMYQPTPLDYLIYSRGNGDVWPFNDDISEVFFISNTFDFFSDEEIVLRYVK